MRLIADIAAWVAVLVLLAFSVWRTYIADEEPQQSQAAIEATYSTVYVTVARAGGMVANPEDDELSPAYARMFTEDEAEMLLRVAMAEASGESVEGKAMVMLVVLNRVEYDKFPNTIAEVIFEEGQFTVTKAGGRYYTIEPDEGCYEALEMVMNGWDESQGALYFESCDGSSWQSENLEFLFQLGGHRFYSNNRI